MKFSKPATLLAAASMLVLCGHAHAQDSASPTQAEDETPSVTAYPASFFDPFRPNSAMDMIGRLPGFSFNGGNDARGFAGTGGNVLIDGERPPSRGDSLSDVLGRIPAESVARIDLVRGGAGGIDMQGFTIIANVIRKAAGGVQGSFATTLNVSEFGEFFPYAQLQLQKRGGARLVEGSLTANFDDFTIRARGERRDPSDVLLRSFKHVGDQQDLSYSGTAAYEDDVAGGRLRVNTRLEHHWTDGSNPNRLLFPGGGELDLYREHGTTGELGLRYNHDVFGKGSVELVGYQQLLDNTFIDDFTTPEFRAGRNSLRRSGESIVDAKLKLPPHRNLAIETGVEGVFNFVDQTDQFTVDGAPLSLAGDSSRVEELRGEAFATATWRPRTTLSFEAGLRYEYSTITADGTAGSSEKTLAFPKPRAVFTWSPNKHHQLVLRVERTIGQLNFDSFSASAEFNTGVFGVGNAEIEPEKTWTYEARYEYRFAERGSVLVQYTYDDQSDVLGRVVVPVVLPGDTEPTFFEINRNISTVRDNTLVFNTDLPLDRLGVSGGLLALKTTFHNARTRDPVTGEPRNISGTEAANWHVNLSQNVNHLNLTWNVNADSGDNFLQYAPRQVSRVDNRWRLGAAAAWKPSSKLSLTVGGNNLNGGYNKSRFTLFEKPRPDGAIRYVETSRGYNKSQIYVALRRSF